MNWFREFNVLTECMSTLGDNLYLRDEIGYLRDEIGRVVKNNCLKEDDVLGLMESKGFRFLLKKYNKYRDGNVYNLDDKVNNLFKDFFSKFFSKFICELIVKCFKFQTKKGVGLRLIDIVVRYLDGDEPLYRRCRRLLLKIRPQLLKGGEGSRRFFQFLKEICVELSNGLRDFVKTQDKWPDISSLLLYVSYLEGDLGYPKNDQLNKCCNSLVKEVDELLSLKLDKTQASGFFDLIGLVTRLAKLCNGEIYLQNMVVERTKKIMDLAELVAGSRKFNSRILMWLQEQDLVSKFFLVLIENLSRLLKLVSVEKVSIHTLESYYYSLKVAKNVAREVEGGDKCLEDVFKNMKEEENTMYRMMFVVEDEVCPEESLVGFKDLSQLADHELRNKLILGIIPQIKDGITLQVEVDREKVLTSSKKILLKPKNSKLIGGKLFVRFKGEEGVGRGVTKEWLYLTCQELFKPQYGYFKREGADQRKALPTVAKVDDPEIYNFFGRLIALALMHRVQVGVTLDPVVVRMLADLNVSIAHVKNFDPILCKNINVQVQIDAASDLDELFDQLTPNERDNPEVIEKIMEDFYRERSQSYVDEYFIKLVDGKIASVKEGIDSVFGHARRKLFFQTVETTHLDMLTRGDSEDLCVDEWEQHTAYEDCQRNDIHISSFWKIVRELSEEEKTDLLFFWASIRFLPPGGFINLKPRLVIGKMDIRAYPRASTCTNTLFVPQAPYARLKYLLKTAVRQPSEFGLK